MVGAYSSKDYGFTANTLPASFIPHQGNRIHGSPWDDLEHPREAGAPAMREHVGART